MGLLGWYGVHVEQLRCGWLCWMRRTVLMVMLRSHVSSRRRASIGTKARIYNYYPRPYMARLTFGSTELFLPSYADHDADLEHRPDPVHEITLTDEEAAQIFPQ